MDGLDELRAFNTALWDALARACGVPAEAVDTLDEWVHCTAAPGADQVLGDWLRTTGVPLLGTVQARGRALAAARPGVLRGATHALTEAAASGDWARLALVVEQLHAVAVDL